MTIKLAEAQALIEERQWTMVDLYVLVCAYAAKTDGSLEMTGPRVTVRFKRLAAVKPKKKAGKP